MFINYILLIMPKKIHSCANSSDSSDSSDDDN